jgi:beta-hydroxylase
MTAHAIPLTRFISFKGAIKLSKRAVPLLVASYFLPKITLFYVVCGVVDVMRNSPRNLETLNRYFFGNGVFTWLLSPLNLFMDVLAFPYRNKGIYELADLPVEYQQEITEVLAVADRGEFLNLLDRQMENRKRLMLFFKWYGVNNSTFGSVPEFHQPRKFIRTIGVSAFNGRQSTSRHFGPLRATLRVLYNVGPTPNGQSFIEVGTHVNHWRDKRLFIFDDTLMHQSVNNADGVRYCMFIDILRPSPWPSLMSLVVRGVRVCLSRSRSIFYKNWDIAK